MPDHHYRTVKILIGCETSGHTREAFRTRGHEVMSCDLLPADDGSPQHWQGDVFECVKRFGPLDLALFHPSCKYLSGWGLHWNSRPNNEGRTWAHTHQAVAFVKTLWALPIARVAIENPVGALSTLWMKPAQCIQPYDFNEDASKKTCLWLRNLPILASTGYFPPRIVVWNGKEVKRWSNQTDSGQNKLGPSIDRWKIRSITYQGISYAMADQWTQPTTELPL